MDAAVRASTLPSGVRVVTEAVPGAASVALGFWVDTGSARETPEENGVSHFIEHLVFKGTGRRSPRAIAEEIECLGGSINAFTGKEHTCFHARIASDHLHTAVDVLADLVSDALLRPADIELERDVVLQEIVEAEETPEDFVFEYHLEHYWPGVALGRPVAGTVQSVGGLSPAVIHGYRDRHYRSPALLVTAAGAVDHERLVALVEAALAGFSADSVEAPAIVAPHANPGVFTSGGDLEQVHIVFGMPGLVAADPRQDVLEVLLTALGGGMSSRLFQSVREERGLAYSIYSFHSSFAVAGYSGVYAAVAQESAAELVEVVLDELAAAAREGLDEAELERTKGQLVGAIPLAMEATENRMFRLARDFLVFGRLVPLDETVRLIRATTSEDVRALAEELFAPRSMSVALHGRVDASAVPSPRDAA